MKTSESFFPTKAFIHVYQEHQEHPYQLIRKHPALPPHRTSTDQHQTSNIPINIFKELSQTLRNSLPHSTVARPVGGVQLFKKVQNSNMEKNCSNRKLSKRSNRETTLQINNNHSTFTRFRKEKVQQQQRENQENSPIKAVPQHKSPSVQPNNHKEENYKSHITYFASTNSFKPSTPSQNTKSLLKSQMSRPSTCKGSTSKGSRQQNWAKVQREEYHDKIALLNEINYNKPLVQKYGDRYFEYLLRNRFEEDLKPAPYIYQVSSKKFSESKVISKIKCYRPDLKEKQALAIKGRKLKESSTQN